MQVILETERLFLRKMTMEDFDSLYVVLADSDIMQHYPYALDEKRVREWIGRNMKRYEENGFGLWAVCLKDTGEMIGDCGLTLQNIEGEMLPEIGYHIRRDCQCRGYAKEAAAAVRSWAFQNTVYPALYSYCKYTNIQLVCILTKSIRMKQMKSLMFQLFTGKIWLLRRKDFHEGRDGHVPKS